MADLVGFHLANLLRATHPAKGLLNRPTHGSNEEASDSQAAENGASHSDITPDKADSDDEENSEEDEEDEGAAVLRALDKVRAEWNQNILTFKAMVASKRERQQGQLLSDSDFPPLEEQIEYGMEDAGYTYKTPIWPMIDDSDDTDTISDTDSLLNHHRDADLGQPGDELPEYGAIAPPVLPPRIDIQKPHGSESQSSSLSSIIYDRAWLVNQCTAHLTTFGDPSTELTPKRLSIDVFTILRSDKSGNRLISGRVELFLLREYRLTMMGSIVDDDIQMNLVDLIGFENFEFITVLLTNRQTIVDNVMAQVRHDSFRKEGPYFHNRVDDARVGLIISICFYGT
jgi:hypothetical protein